MNPACYVGIDNGVSGALALIGSAGSLVGWIAMPVQKTRKGNEVDVRGVLQFLVRHNIHPENTIVVIEEPGGSKSAKAAASMAGSFHALRALFESRHYKLIRVTPQQWQKPMLKCGKGDTKPVALQMARSLWPDESWLETERCTKPHDGAVDGALLAEFARRNNL